MVVDRTVEQDAAELDPAEAFAVRAFAADDTSALKSEIADLQREVERLTDERARLVLTDDQVRGGVQRKDPNEPAADNVYVLADDTVEARAFDEFYSAYDEVHAKTREFLLG